MDTQTLIPAALAAIHNFICEHDPGEIEEYLQNREDIQTGGAVGLLAAGPARQHEREAANTRRNDNAQNMWLQYQENIQARGS